jgi:hypothetical protein
VNAALPAVLDRLVALLPTLPGWSKVTVYDGPTLTRDAPVDFVTVGYVDGEDFGGTFEPGESFGDLWQEIGTVRSEIVSQTGGDDISGRRARVFELFNAWQVAVQADQTLGGVVASAGMSADLQPVQNTNGSAVRLAVTLTYTARGI